MKSNQEFKDEHTLYVGDLHTELTRDEVENFFSTYGKVLKVKLFEPSNKKAKAYAFVCFENRIDAVRAMQQAQYTPINDIPIRILFKDEEKNFLPNTNLQVENIASDVTLRELHSFFAQYGDVVCVKKVEAGRGFVQFRKPEEAMAAEIQLNG